MKAVVADPVGGPENLKYIDVDRPKPSADQVLIELKAIGVNFIDTYFRKGLYKAPEYPVQLGNEGAGVVVEVGEQASKQFKPGQRVAYAMSRGSYAEFAAVPRQFVVRLPDAITFDDAAAVMLQGMTAHYLTHSTFPLRAGQTCLLHAAAGGAGLLILQIAKIAGATVIGTVSTEQKAELAKTHGADHVIRYEDEDWVAAVKRLTNNVGVDVVYDSVGKTTFGRSLDCLKPRGLMVTFGQSSGPIGEVDPLNLMQKGSLYLTRPNLSNYISDEQELAWRTSDLFRWIAEGKLKTHIFRSYKLADAAQAHRDLESRQTVGKLLLEP